MNIKRIFSGLVFIGICVYLLSACIKPDNPSSTYTIKGRILHNNNEPVRSLKIGLKFPWKPIGSKVSTLITRTDTIGNFELSNIPTARTKNLRLEAGQYDIIVFNIATKPRRGETIDWGDIYMPE